MYSIHDVISYNCKNVRVKTKTGHEYSGRCHVHCELGDDDETMEEYVSINGGLCIGIEDIAEITEIKD